MKTTYFNLILFIFLSLINFSCSTDEELTTESQYDLRSEIQNYPSSELSESTLLNLTYGTGEFQNFNIFLPEGRSTAKTKVLILLHGGMWIAGDKSGMNVLMDRLKIENPNHAIVNMNYSIANAPGKYAFPNQFLDVGLIIEHLKENKNRYNINPEFGLIGASSGGHISLMYDYVYDQKNDVKFVCAIVSPVNFTDPYYAEIPQYEILFNTIKDPAVYPDNDAALINLSPALQVSEFNSSPTIMFYGNNDSSVPLSNPNLLYRKLVTNNIDESYNIYNGGHNNWDPEDYRDMDSKLNDFINQHLPVN